jgi:hypothetical protein
VRVTLHSDGTLDETYTYKIVSIDTRFLFRFWEARALFESLMIHKWVDATA